MLIENLTAVLTWIALGFFVLNTLHIVYYWIICKIFYARLKVTVQELGQQIVALRKAEKISQQVLADAIGVSRATINSLENGRSHDVGVRKVMKILDFFHYELCIKQRTRFPTFEELRDAQ